MAGSAASQVREEERRRRAYWFLKLLHLAVIVLKAYDLYLSMERPKKRTYRRAFREDPELPYKRLRNLSSKEFRTLYRIKKSRFNKIFKDFEWERGECAAKKKGHYAEVKLAACIRHFSMGVPSRALTDVYSMGEATLRFEFEKFVNKFIELYEDKYLKFDLRDVIKVNQEKHGIPGMLGSLDCTHINWAQCPRAHMGAYVGRSGHPTIILEAVADARRRIIHYHWGVPGAQNDLNVLKGSPLLDLLLSDTFPRDLSFSLGGARIFQTPYLLVDGIYPGWSCFVGTVKDPPDERWAMFKKLQERWRKDVECAFGLIKKMWHILQRHLLKRRTLFLSKVVQCVLILHNMCIEDNLYENFPEDELAPFEGMSLEAQARYANGIQATPTLRETSRRMRAIQDTSEHNVLMEEIKEYINENFNGQ